MKWAAAAVAIVAAAFLWWLGTPEDIFREQEMTVVQVRIYYRNPRTQYLRDCADIPGAQACRLTGSPLNQVIDALQGPARSRWLQRLPENQDGRWMDIQVRFTNGHYRWLWAYDHTPPGIFFGGGGATTDGRDMGYLYGKLGYFRYESKALWDALATYAPRP